MKPIKQGFIYGSGAQGRVALDILRCQYPKAEWFFIDDDKHRKGENINGVEVLGGIDVLREKKNPKVHVAIGKPSLKMKIAKNCIDISCEFISAIHPTSVIALTASIGENVMIGATAVVNSNAVIHDHVIINTGAIIEHDTVIYKCANVSPAACIGGRVLIKENSFIGSGAIVLARTSVGENSVVGMGAVVTKDVPSESLSYGVPAKVIKKIDEKFNWAKVL